MSRCADCGTPCSEKADDGKYYCDSCWNTWQRSSEIQKKAWSSRAETAWKAKAIEASVQAQRVRDAEKLAQARRERNAAEISEASKREKEYAAKESKYWADRAVAEQKLLGTISADVSPADTVVATGKEQIRRETAVTERGFLDVLPPSSDTEVVSEKKEQVVYWGICDLKYDPDLPRRDRVKVLELGDGRSSRFSYANGRIQRLFHASYVMDSLLLKRGVLVENKKLTHDTFVENGLGFLRPKQFAYPRQYKKGLADIIAKDLGVQPPELVVIKLVNRARGAGVVVCPVAELEETLKKLLSPPTGKELKEWLDEAERRPLADCLPSAVIAEQRLHYWSNESPIFVVEEMCRSVPLVHACLENHKGEHDDGMFDGTMRVVFVLKRSLSDEAAKQTPIALQEDQGRLELDWLDGYWKLPPQRVPENNGQPGTLEEIRARIVSSFNTEEKRTAPVAREHLAEVFATLQPALITVFENSAMSCRTLMFKYSENLSFRAYLLARQSAALRIKGDLSHCMHVLRIAEQQVKGCDEVNRCVLSYINRCRGAAQAILKKNCWDEAHSMFLEAVAKMGTNATAIYQQGIALQEIAERDPGGGESKWATAAKCHQRAFALDPDFRSPLMALGVCWTRIGQYREAIEASKLCLHLQPDAPVAQFNLGQAIYHMLRGGALCFDPQMQSQHRAEALAALQKAKKGIPSLWTDQEEEMLQYFAEKRSDDPGPVPPVRSWKVYGWRP